MSEFSDRPFVAGSLFGVRSWGVNEDGTLRGVHKREAWHDGVNEAQCHAGWETAYWHLLGAVATLECKCGYYAYFDTGHNPNHRPANVQGIVEAYGTVTVGTRGFRASKARIVALVRTDAAATADLACHCGGCLRLADALGYPTPTTVPFPTIAAHYPSAAVYDTLDAALAEFPLTVPEGTPAPEPALSDTYGAAIAAAAQKFADSLRRITATVSMGGDEIRKLSDAIRAIETPQQRALRLRRERNTGPARNIGLDGTRRNTP